MVSSLRVEDKRMATNILDLQVEHEGVCKGCTLGKNTKGPYPSSDNRSKRILDLVHSDACRPMKVSSLSVFLYYVTFIDDFSWKTWIYFMKTKDEVFNMFQEFKAQTKNLTGKKIKVLRIDNRGEYTSINFSDFCKEAGILRELIVPYNPQQNDMWEIVLRPEGNSMVTSKWIYKIKNASNGSIKKYKVRFVTRGFSHKEGVDYEETFSLVSWYTSIRTIIYLASVMGWRLH
jgi:transposase InsO family protein